MGDPVSGEKKNLIKAAVDARTPVDGPHRPGQKERKSEAKKSASGDTGNTSDSTPSYVVAVTKREKTGEPSTEVSHSYNPQELKAKARAFLNSPQISSAEREVLTEILRNDSKDI
jgi:hypothetical protein